MRINESLKRRVGFACETNNNDTEQIVGRKLDFLIIGAQKAGTTALFEYLGQHRDIFIPAMKEIHYFTRDEFYEQGDSYLSTFYDRAKAGHVLGGAYAHLMFFPEAAQRVREHNACMKLIAILRNPIDRAYSAYWFARRTGWENSSTFEEALEKEAIRAKGTYHERTELTYLAHGHYSEQLRRFLREFGRDQLRVLLTEDLEDTAARSMTAILEWLGVSPDLSGINLNRKVNVSGMPRFPFLQRLLRSDDSRLQRTIRRYTSPRLRYYIMRYVRRPLLTKNIRPYRYPPMDPNMRAQLADHFAPLNAELAGLIGRDLSHWK